jgi:hypothetical protein
VETIRRVVTGIDENGKSVFVSDSQLEALTPAALNGNRIFPIWGSDTTVTVPNDGSPPAKLRFFPQTAGHRYVIFSYPPASKVTMPDDLDAALIEMEELTPGMSEAVTDQSGMHYTATVDLEYVLEGEFTLELDDGATQVIRKGDALIQCGARHAWYNRSEEWATMLLVFVGAEIDESRYAAAAPGVTAADPIG